MRPIRHLLAPVLLALVAGCTTPASRIGEHQAAFAKFPAAVQEEIRAGQVGVGFTAEMVQLSLGEPARKFTRKTASGDTEVWGYRGNGPKLSLGIGLGVASQRSSVAGGLELASGGFDPEERLRVEFRDGVVTAVDRLKP
jgi:hypothetical protein